MTDAEKLDLIDTIIADYFEFGDVDKDANGVLLAVSVVSAYKKNGEEK